MQTGDRPVEHYPTVAGHEGAWVVESVGPNTPSWEVGDHVISSLLPSCGRCRWCAEGFTNLRNFGASTLRGPRWG
ncbi:alcohol dehydrogenase catalytic domain-containing protein [Nocardia gamkensis]|uniref:alcohol dehydrogenase catalytic domain-containing protein n=1 Tax=Nocardia gamkensis TaxID=352869 RepID=UPI0036ED42F1